MSAFLVQRIDSTSITEVTTTNTDLESMVLTNVHASNTAMVIDIMLTEQYGNDIYDTGINVNEALGYDAGTSSTTVTVDGTIATVDLVNKKLWKSDGTLIGTCTARNSNTEIVFGDGLSQKLDNDVDLYQSRYHYLLNNLSIPGASSLRLEENDISFPVAKYKMWIICDVCSTSNPLDITIRR